MRVDSHYHVWRQHDWQQGWIPAQHHAVLGGDFWIDDWERAAVAARLDSGIIVQTVAAEGETPYLLAAAAAATSVIGVVGWVDVSNDVHSQLDNVMAGSGSEFLVGVRLQAEYEPDDDWLSQAHVARAALAAGERGLTVDLLVRPKDLTAAVELAGVAPDTRFVIDHLAKPTLAVRQAQLHWVDGMRALAERPNVALKVSGLRSLEDFEQQAARQHLEVAASSFGASRMMFGSDWPVSLVGGSYVELVQEIEEWTASWSVSEQARLWGESALEWYSLPADRALAEGRST